MSTWPENAKIFLRHNKNLLNLAGLTDDGKAVLTKFVSNYTKHPPISVKASRRIITDEKNVQSLRCWEDAICSQADFHLRHLDAAAAAVKGRYDVLKGLLRRGLDGKFQDSLGRTLLHLLPPPIEASLLQDAGTDPNVQDESGRTALHEAVWSGQKPLVEVLLRRGADPSIQDEDELTPLQDALFVTMYAARPDTLSILGIEAASMSGVEYFPPGAHDTEAIMAMLIDTGAAIDTKISGGLTALHMAALLGLGDIARRLINAGASVNVCDASGNTPLHFAHERRHDHIIQELVRAGADQTAQNNEGGPATGVCLPQAVQVVSAAGRPKKKRKMEGKRAKR